MASITQHIEHSAETPPIRIRPFDYSDADYEQFVALNNEIFPRTPNTVEQRRRWDAQREPKYKFARFVTELDGKLVASAAYGQPPWAYHPHVFSLGVYVKPDMRRQGIGARLYDHVVRQLAQFDPHKLTSGTQEDQPDAVAFLQSRGFARTMRFPVSELDITTFDSEPFAWAFDKVEARGLRLVTFAEWGATDAQLRQLYDFDALISQDIPSPDPVTMQPFEEWAKWRDEPTYRPDLILLALDGDTIAGATILAPDEADPKRLYQWLTGTHRDYRRHGVATALKARNTLTAQRLGYERIQTDNEENNPMYQINLRLGFRALPAELAFEKVLRRETDDVVKSM